MVSKFPDVMSSGHGSMANHENYEKLKAQWDRYNCKDVVGGDKALHCKGMYQNFPSNIFIRYIFNPHV